jgi:hypothetical protein
MASAIPGHEAVPLERAKREQRKGKRKLVFLAIAFLLVTVCVAAGWEVWAAVAWGRYGHYRLAHGDPVMTRFMPQYEVAERHERIVAAPPSVVFQAIGTSRLEDSRIIRSIFRGRELIFGQPAGVRAAQPSFLQLIRDIGWGVLDSTPGREIVFGAVTQPWQGDVHFRSLPIERFASFDSTGFAKIIWSVGIDSLGPEQTRLWTETRVTTTDPESRERFRRYWATYSPGIVLIRREALRIIKNEAEGAASTSVSGRQP